MNEKIFEEDAMDLVEVKTIWTADDLLAREGVFFLKDIVKILELHVPDLKKRVKSLQNSGKNPWHVLGARKIWNHWIIRMKVFAPYYRAHLKPRVRRLSGTWDANSLLSEKGIFFLTQVCRYLPFSAHQIRYQAKKRPDARQKIGVWKDDQLKTFLVDMALFAPWLKTLWQRT